ncbi:hypothetical protein [Psychromonas arctica]|uniref:hypothetical protein n=1 Tax=Psychromonas arctica TaxID=168275 RepID=UPI0004168925|nr:hypothetical protein [Psychromonas arctica]
MDDFKVFGIPVLETKYSKTKSGRDGLYELEFNKLTSKLISEFETDSKSASSLLKRIASEMPELLNNYSATSPWNMIAIQLDKFGIDSNIFNLYEYEGHQYSIGTYLKVRGNAEKNMELIITSQLVFIALAICAHRLANDFENALLASEMLFGCGVLMGEAYFENYIMAGASSTSEATELKIALKEERVKATEDKAKKLKVRFPRISKDAIAEMIYDEIGASKSTVRDYLKTIKL